MHIHKKIVMVSHYTTFNKERTTVTIFSGTFQFLEITYTVKFLYNSRITINNLNTILLGENSTIKRIGILCHKAFGHRQSFFVSNIYKLYS